MLIFCEAAFAFAKKGPKPIQEMALDAASFWRKGSFFANTLIDKKAKSICELFLNSQCPSIQYSFPLRVAIVRFLCVKSDAFAKNPFF